MASTGPRNARLFVDGREDPIELPILKPSLGNDVIDIGRLTNEGYFTYDPGFVSTASCDSNITYIDGDAGTLLHRGYPIEQLAEQSDFVELCYLLLKGSCPRRARRRATPPPWPPNATSPRACATWSATSLEMPTPWAS